MDCAKLTSKCSGWVRPYAVNLNGKWLNRHLCDGCARTARKLLNAKLVLTEGNLRGIVWRRAPGGASHAVHGTVASFAPNALCGIATGGLTEVGSRRFPPSCRLCKDRFAHKPVVSPAAAATRSAGRLRVVTVPSESRMAPARPAEASHD